MASTRKAKDTALSSALVAVTGDGADDDAVVQIGAHIVQKEVGERVKPSEGRFERRRMAGGTANVLEDLFAP